jgi:hypothetical protein
MVLGKKVISKVELPQNFQYWRRKMVMLGTHKSLIIVMLSEHFAGLPG